LITTRHWPMEITWW